MSYVGDISLGQTFDTKFCTVQSTGAPTTLAASPVISCYVGNNTTELTAGITLTADFDSRTGLNNVRVVATVANGYAQATDNQLVITTGTVNSVSAVGYVVAEFSIQNRSNSLIGAGVGPFPMSGIVDAGTAQAVTGTTIQIRSAATFADSELVGATVVILSATTGAGQRRLVTANVGSTDTLTVDTWTTTPSGTIIYAIFASAPGSTTSPAPTNVLQWNSTAVSTPATAGIPDINVKNINNVTAATPGASGGILISGSNSGTTTLGALTVSGAFTVTGATVHTGNVSMAAGLNITQSSSNTSALVVTGNGTGHGAVITSGAGATGDGVRFVAGSTAGNGLSLVKTGSGSDLNATVTPLVLAKTTNITGFNDIAATAVVSSGAITTSGGAVTTVTTTGTLTNAPMKKNTQLVGFSFYMTDSTSHAAKTGLVITAERSIDGAAFAACANAATEVANGEYKITLAAADLNGNSIMLKFTAAAADQRMISVVTFP